MRAIHRRAGSASERPVVNSSHSSMLDVSVLALRTCSSILHLALLPSSSTENNTDSLQGKSGQLRRKLPATMLHALG